MRHRGLVFLIPALILAVVVPLPAQVERDLAYGRDASQRLDLSVPPVKSYPTVIFVHGGSLAGGDKADSDYRDVCTPFPAVGVACANVNYRLAPANPWPAAGDDIAAAVAWIKQNIKTRGGDPDNLFLFGHSSGATIVALLGADEKYLTKYGLKSDALRGVIPMGSIMWDDDMQQAITRAGRDRVAEAFPRRSNANIWGSFEVYMDYWPYGHIRRSMPPYLFLIAENEQINPPILMTNTKFVETSRAMGNTVDIQVIKGRTHYSNIRKLAEKDDPVFALVRDFISKYRSLR